MNFFDEKKAFLQDQVGSDDERWPELLRLSKTKRKQIMKNFISTKQSAAISKSLEQQLLDQTDQELADLERRRLKMSADLKLTQARLRDLLKKRKKLAKVLELDKPIEAV